MRTFARLFACLGAFGPACLGLGFLASCGPVPDPRGSSPVDLHPPVIQSVFSSGPEQIVIQFDEEARLPLESLRISPSLSVAEATQEGSRVLVRSEGQIPGLPYVLEGEAQDKSGNVAAFMAEFYGFNPRVPRLLLNELTPRGTTDHPDLAEIKVMAAGDMGGVVIYQGTPGDFTDRFVFPAFAVRAGTFILVHFKPAGDQAEVNETADPALSGGIDASPSALDFWIPGGQGLGGNNGVVSIYERPGGKPIDGLLYSNRTSEADEAYRGFGSAATLARAEELVRDGAWRISGQRVAPEDAVNPEGSTATRSICRSSSGADTDTAADWHIVPTRGSTFGAENSDEVYVPPPLAALPKATPRSP